MAEEVVKKLKVDAVDAVATLLGVTRAEVELLKALEQGAKGGAEATKAASARFQALSEIRQTLTALTAAEEAHLQSIMGGREATEADHKAAAMRREEMGRLEQTLAEAAVADQKATAAIRERTQAMLDANKPAVEQVKTLQDLQRELEQLITEQIRYKTAVLEGKAVTEQDIDLADQRDEKIKHLSDTLAQQAAAEVATRESIRQSTQQILAATQIEETREKSLAELSKELTELIKVENEHAVKVKAGYQATSEEEQKSQARKVRIDEITRELGKQEAAQRQATDAVKKSADAFSENKTEAGGLNGTLSNLRGEIVGMISGYFTLATVLGVARTALQAQRQELEENIKKTRELAQASLDLQFQSQTFNPNDRAFVNEQAVLGGRSPVEVAKAYADLKSRFPQFSDEENQALMARIVESGTTTSGGLSSIVDAFSTISQYERDPVKAQNIFRESIVQGGVSDPSKISPLFAQFLPVGRQIAGLSTAQSAGAVAAATGLGLNPADAVTALRNVALSISGKGTPEGMRVLASAGINRSDFFGALGQISEGVQNGRIQKSDLEKIAGREGVALMATLADPAQLKEFMGKVNKVVDSGTSSTNITSDAIAGQQTDEITRLNMEVAQQIALKEVFSSSDPGALQMEKTRLEMLNQMKLRGSSAFARWAADSTYWAGSSLGLGPQDSAGLATFVGMSDLHTSNWLLDQPGDVSENIPLRRPPLLNSLPQANPSANTTINIINPIYNSGSPPHQDSGRVNEGRF